MTRSRAVTLLPEALASGQGTDSVMRPVAGVLIGPDCEQVGFCRYFGSAAPARPLAVAGGSATWMSSRSISA